MFFPFFDHAIHHMVAMWIGKTACHGGALVGIGAACRGPQALNMGLIVLALAAMLLAATWLNVRRKRRRAEDYFW
jgi:hypothetical protein